MPDNHRQENKKIKKLIIILSCLLLILLSTLIILTVGLTAENPMLKILRGLKRPAAVLLLPGRQKTEPGPLIRKHPTGTDPPELPAHPVRTALPILTVLPGTPLPIPEKSPSPSTIFSFRTPGTSLRTAHSIITTRANTLPPGKSFRETRYIFGYTEGPIRKTTIFLWLISAIYAWCITILTAGFRSEK